MILEGGGNIMEFEELKKTVQESEERESGSVILIANSHRKTMKYYLALARGFPRVSSKWIFKCKDQVKKGRYR
jgi:hypothetical protein